jgi:hypothetical protein
MVNNSNDPSQQQQQDQSSSSRSKSCRHRPVLCGGIGEVCTVENHRRRGLSRALLENAIEIMKSRQLSISLLHAWWTFFPVYQSLGYTCSRTEWSTVTVNGYNGDDARQQQQQQQQQQPNHFPISVTVRHAEFPDDTDQLCDLYQQYTHKHHRLVGCINRSKRYWNEYLSIELKDSLFLLVMNDNNHDDGSNDDRIIGWLSIRPRGHNNNVPIFQLQEFGLDLQFVSKSSHVSPAAVFGHLLGHALMPHLDDDSIKSFTTTMMIPRFVANDIRPSDATTQYIDWDSETIDIDEGWMYLNLDDNKEVFDLSCMKGTDPTHFIWPSDSF